jgi:hypothetical protein
MSFEFLPTISIMYPLFSSMHFQFIICCIPFIFLLGRKIWHAMIFVEKSQIIHSLISIQLIMLLHKYIFELFSCKFLS